MYLHKPHFVTPIHLLRDSTIEHTASWTTQIFFTIHYSEINSTSKNNFWEHTLIRCHDETRRFNWECWRIPKQQTRYPHGSKTQFIQAFLYNIFVCKTSVLDLLSFKQFKYLGKFLCQMIKITSPCKQEEISSQVTRQKGISDYCFKFINGSF